MGVGLTDKKEVEAPVLDSDVALGRDLSESELELYWADSEDNAYSAGMFAQTELALQDGSKNGFYDLYDAYESLEQFEYDLEGVEDTCIPYAIKRRDEASRMAQMKSELPEKITF